MEVRKLFTDDRAVSPVVGVALLIAVAVILAAVIGAVVLGLGTGGVETPQAQLQADYDTTANEITVEHNGGEPLPAEHTKFSDPGGEVTLENVNAHDGSDLTAGDSVMVDSANDGLSLTGDTVKVIWDDPNSDSETVLEEFDP